MNRDVRLLIVCAVAWVICFGLPTGFLRAIGLVP